MGDGLRVDATRQDKIREINGVSVNVDELVRQSNNDVHELSRLFQRETGVDAARAKRLAGFAFRNRGIEAPGLDEVLGSARNRHAVNGSFFDGDAFSFLGWALMSAIVTSLTFGICFPWAVCMFQKWKIEHTVIEGKRMQFNGQASKLLGQWIKWIMLCIVTLGIYGLWVSVKLEAWIVENTSFEDNDMDSYEHPRATLGLEEQYANSGD